MFVSKINFTAETLSLKNYNQTQVRKADKESYVRNSMIAAGSTLTLFNLVLVGSRGYLGKFVQNVFKGAKKETKKVIETIPKKVDNIQDIVNSVKLFVDIPNPLDGVNKDILKPATNRIRLENGHIRELALHSDKSIYHVLEKDENNLPLWELSYGLDGKPRSYALLQGNTHKYYNLNGELFYIIENNEKSQPIRVINLDPGTREIKSVVHYEADTHKYKKIDLYKDGKSYDEKVFRITLD